MGVKSIINTGRLFWLGRYSERVYTTLKLFSRSFDSLIDTCGGDHGGFCASLEIPDIYTDDEAFLREYPFSPEDPNSIHSNLQRAYDNAIVLRDEIGSESLSFIQMAVYEMEEARRSQAPVLHFQKITDAILAFWGCIDDQIDDENTRNIIKIGKRVQRLKKREAEGRLVPGRQIMVIPSINPSSMNIGKRFWGIDNTDINRMFPGYDQGETTQRIAAGVFEIINKYRFGVQFTSFYMPGEFQPHVRMMRTGFENVEKAGDFGLPYIVVREPRPYDTTTLNYNWQIWETDAFSLYSNTTSRIDMDSAEMVVDAIERFMMINGLLEGTPPEAAPCRVFPYEALLNIRTTQAGLYHSLVPHNSAVRKGQPLARILDPCSGDVLEELKSPVDGVIFFQHNEPLIFSYTSALKLLEDSSGNMAE